MLKFTIPLLSLLFFQLLQKNYWIMMTCMYFIISSSMLTFLPSQLMIQSSLSSLMMTDTLSTPLIILTAWVTALMLMASYKEKINQNNPKLFTTYMTLLATILLITFASHNMMMFYIFFETSLIPTVLLILGWGYQPERLQASMYLILYTVTASLPLLLSLMLMYSSSMGLSFVLTHWDPLMMSKNLSSTWWLITILAFMTKMPLYMLHLWLPKAHVEAPVAGSMILAGILLKLGSYGLLRLSSMMVKFNPFISSPLLSLSLWGATLTSMVCLRQTDLKSLIAYSSIGHMSLLMAGILSNSSWGWNASLTMMLAHGLCSSSLFALANMTYESTQTRSMFLTKGMMTIFPTMTMWWFLNCIMNMAAPPTSNLLSELFLIMGTISLSFWSATLMAMTVFLAAAYSLHLYASSQHGPTSTFTLPLNLFTQRNYTTTTLHLIPATALTLKSDIIMAWL